ncbi:hypothetical protein [Nocardia sp. NPDC059195]|uniref:hypothetical protein n=1 Tax=Nocardia sp. NPDC059195 TaxID=3346765 RepID=UPI00367F71AD
MSTTKERARARDIGAGVSIKLNQLFAAGHPRGGDEESNADVAAAVSGVLDRPISGSEIAALRADTHEAAGDSAVLAAVAEHFGMPAGFLVQDDGTHDLAAAQTDMLRVLELIRDLGAASGRL